jgi:FkbM family methyltransferase
VLDVGANTGQFAYQTRKEVGYTGRMVSFEPLKSAYQALGQAARKDSLWEVFSYGLGDENTAKEINIAGNSVSSSLLAMLPAHVNAEPESLYVGTETIEIRTLDSVFESLYQGESGVFLKIDTQGYERRVLAGAADSLARINTIQLEMSLVSLYEEDLLFIEMYELLSEMGYTMVSMEPGFSNPRTGQLLQVDGVFHRS